MTTRKGSSQVADPNDAFWLAQTYFLTGQYLRAERILTKPLPPPALQRASPSNTNGNGNGNGHGKGKERAEDDDQQLEDVLGRRDDFGNGLREAKLSALVDQSLPCLYLVAQCLVSSLQLVKADELGPSREIYPSIRFTGRDTAIPTW